MPLVPSINPSGGTRCVCVGVCARFQTELRHVAHCTRFRSDIVAILYTEMWIFTFNFTVGNLSVQFDFCWQILTILHSCGEETKLMGC